jgi:dolichol kinase
MLTKKEFGRQILHMLIGSLAILLFYLNILSPFAIFLGIICGVLLSLISKRVNLPIFSFFLKNFERPEQHNFPGKGMIFFFIGMLLVIELFDRNIALAAMMVLTFGDSLSHIFGAHFGQIKNIFNGKSRKLLEGTMAGTLGGFAAAALFVPIPEAFLGSMAAMIAEVVKIDFNDHTLDDNLIVPLVAGTVMLLVRVYL